MPEAESTVILEKPEPGTIRDQRIDWLGFAKEVAKYFETVVKPKVKETLAGKNASRAVGEFFECILEPGYATRSIDAAKFLKLCQKKKAKKADILAAMAVNKAKAKKLLSDDEIESISVPGDKRDASLTVERRGGVEFKLVDAIKSIGEAIK